MDNISLEKDRKGEFSLLVLILAALVIAAIISVFFTNYKNETLTCSKSQDICSVEKINLLNMKSQKVIVQYSDISSVSYIKEKVKGNRYAKGYSLYLLTFVLNDNNQKVIFKSAYYEKSEINKAVKDLQNQISSNSDTITLKKDY